MLTFPAVTTATLFILESALGMEILLQFGIQPGVFVSIHTIIVP